MLSDADRLHIENKYHKSGEPFDPYRRMAYHGYDFDPATGMTDGEILAGLSAMAEELAALPHPIAKARAVAYTLDHTRIDVNEHDYFVGLYSLDRLAGSVTVSRWKKELFGDLLPETKVKMDEMCASGAATVWPDFDHVVPDWDAILTLGIPGLRARAAARRQAHREAGTLSAALDAHFEGIDIELCAVERLLERLYAHAAAQHHDKAVAITQCLDHLRAGPPTDIYEAMQLMYLYFIISECFDNYQVRSLGHGLDGSLRPFYEKDLACGRYDRATIRTLLSYFLLQWSAIGNYWGQPFYLGGTAADGGTLYDDLSRDILRAYEDLGIYNPKIQLKVAENTPTDILDQAFSMIRRGQGSIVFCCEPGMTAAVRRYATAEEARTMDIRGCYETGVRGGEVCTGTHYINAAKAVQYVLTNGYEPNLGKTFGLATGTPEAFCAFEDFYRATLAQWEHLIERMIEQIDAYEPYLSTINPSLLYSATVDHSLVSGRDAYQNGARYNNTALLNCAFASMVDALMAVKYLVYETHAATLRELGEALAANWVGHEALLTRARKCPHKYGCGDATADGYAAALSDFFTAHVEGRPNARGGVYKANMHSAMQFVWQGTLTPATADGRRDGEELSKNGSPSVGADREGITALIRSALSLHPSHYSESFCLDTMLHPSAVQGEEGLCVLRALLMTYLRGGGMSIQFNVFGAETLKDARAHPEKYQNLQVRVCGWNVLWNDLSPAEQDAYIRRAETVG